MIRTLTGDIAVDRAGFILVHEHVSCDFAKATGDPDLAFTAHDEIAADLADARREGANLIVEVSTYDMGAAPHKVAAMCAAADLLVVKSTGWFRSPLLDATVAAETTETLTTRLIADLCDGFEGTTLRAGVIGEVGLLGSVATRDERIALDAAAAASLATGAGVIAHTDDWENASAVLRELTHRGVARDRIMLGHCRCADPIASQQEVLESGVTLSFDQLGHPERDRIAAVAERIDDLLDRGCSGRLAVSADVGRLSRLRSRGGSGYMPPVRRLFAELVTRGVSRRDIDDLTRSAPARLLSWRLTGDQA